ncbi:hypothetical protein [Roseisolibacter agri]|uniref:Alpha/beta hydrolase family protein n=1 Tax=Roseisolibacter agri TaxID=2014610 RepID=A0AA37QAN1_9BACT|nr:hypothetical protein [Roseisolibacter agri]GLC27802.1 hypothetical protein rosag_43150 [Roseisolibacter agri]
MHGRDAIIFVPGLFVEGGVQSADVAARRIARAFDENAATHDAQFLVLEGKDESLADDYRTRKATVVRLDVDGVELPIVDVFDFRYHDTLLGAYQNRTPARQALSITGTLLALFGRVMTSIRKPSKTAAEKWQVAYGVLVMLGLVAYVGVLLATAIATLPAVVPGSSNRQVAVASPPTTTASPVTTRTPQTRAPAPVGGRRPGRPWIERARDTGRSVWAGATGTARAGWTALRSPALLGRLQGLLVILTAIGLLRTQSLKTVLREVAAGAAAASAYLATGERAARVRGAFGRLLQHVLESKVEGRAYERIHVVAFSFGSVVALDSIFPVVRPAHHLGRISTLVTIGCPFDFIRTYWPRYFDDRQGLPDAPGKWLNVFAGADVLGSNFLDEPAKQAVAKPRGIRMTNGAEERIPESLRYGGVRDLADQPLSERLTLVGFRTHRRAYWDGVESDSCFHDIVPVLYAEHAAMR